ncbi:mannosyltransferase [Pholiota conissans]|uniref:GDP-Man:Man(3)GlcNAc(2)-PP-Dol alpha-1,2-mannosyltransferase n=1 Tax=Pholiota conissans TaxID=109636 RepID=A0A9P6CTA2_9AGAR|nr:mannosyltransferase [Pholiota conissans]
MANIFAFFVFGLSWILFAQFLSALLIVWVILRVYSHHLRSSNLVRRSTLLAELGHSHNTKRIVGFFHPYCNAGGGGERVLWTAIAAIQRTDPDVVSVVYSGDTEASKESIISKVKARFAITLDPVLLHFVFLQSRWLVEDSTWPRFTLLGQSIGSMYLAWESMTKLIPDLFIDTMGYAFTFHIVAQLGQIPIGAYVHYPTISTDMLARVKSRKQWHTNAGHISSSATLSRLKLIYYRLFMYYYVLSLRTASFVMVNSSWTKNHVDSILQYNDPLIDAIHMIPPLVGLKLFTSQNAPAAARIVYPPCDTREMSSFSLMPRQRIILSVAQFRPEKDHQAQLNAFHRLIELHPEYIQNSHNRVKLILVGGSRNDSDAKRLSELQKVAKDLGIDPYVEFVVNASYPTVLSWLSKASVGLSTMVDEHFGINIVEFMAAGVIPVAHASGGPLQDIIVPFNGERTGFHARTLDEFAGALHTVLSLPTEEELAMRWRARAWAVQRFSEEEFERGWNQSGWRTWALGSTSSR